MEGERRPFIPFILHPAFPTSNNQKIHSEKSKIQNSSIGDLYHFSTSWLFRFFSPDMFSFFSDPCYPTKTISTKYSVNFNDNITIVIQQYSIVQLCKRLRSRAVFFNVNIAPYLTFYMTISEIQHQSFKNHKKFFLSFSGFQKIQRGPLQISLGFSCPCSAIRETARETTLSQHLAPSI